MEVPNHITDLTRRDFEQIARVANIEQGYGIILEPIGNKLVISIDENAIKRIAWIAANGDVPTR